MKKSKLIDLSMGRIEDAFATLKKNFTILEAYDVVLKELRYLKTKISKSKFEKILVSTHEDLIQVGQETSYGYPSKQKVFSYIKTELDPPSLVQEKQTDENLAYAPGYDEFKAEEEYFLKE